MTADRKRLPIYIDPDERVGDGPYIGWPTQWGDAVLYVPEPATCATCESFFIRRIGEHLSNAECGNPKGLKEVMPDGGQWCCYHRDRENQRT